MGNLPRRICERDIHKLFRKFGRIRSVDLTTPRRKAPFAVIQFEGMRLRNRVVCWCLTCVVSPDGHSCSKAIRDRNGYNVDGCCLRVQFFHDRRRGRHRHRSSCHSTSAYVAGVFCRCFAVALALVCEQQRISFALWLVWQQQRRASTQSPPGEPPQPLADKEVQSSYRSLGAQPRYTQSHTQ